VKGRLGLLLSGALLVLITSGVTAAASGTDDTQPASRRVTTARVAAPDAVRALEDAIIVESRSTRLLDRDRGTGNDDVARAVVALLVARGVTSVALVAATRRIPFAAHRFRANGCRAPPSPSIDSL
jgi:hypothetical protein